MPASPADGMTITISSDQQITALTMSGNGGTIVGPAVQLIPNQPLSWVYRLANTTWYPVYGGAGRATALVSGTAVASTSGTSIDFTGIPSWVKRITVMFMGVSVSGTSIPIVQLGDSGGIETTTYLGTAGGSNAASANSVSQMSVGFNLIDTGDAAITLQGRIEISLGNLSTNTWCANGTLGNGNTTTCFWMGGVKSLSGTLDRVRITTVNGTDTFDAGSINIIYE
jgi:hypothetical protein